MAKVVNSKVSAETLASWRESQVSIEPKYKVDPDAETLEVPAFAFETVVKDGGWGDWFWISFQLKGEKKPFEFQTHRNKELDVEAPITITKYVCSEDFKASNGTVVKAGKVQWRAVQD